MKRMPMRAVLGLPVVLVAVLGPMPRPAGAFHEATVHVEAGAWLPGLEQ